MMKVKVVLEDVGVRKNGAKCELFENIPLHVQKLNYKKNVYELKDQFGEKAQNLNLLPKLGTVRRIIPIGFLDYLLESV
jgi:hypothetical protein